MYRANKRRLVLLGAGTKLEFTRPCCDLHGPAAVLLLLYALANFALNGARRIRDKSYLIPTSLSFSRSFTTYLYLSLSIYIYSTYTCLYVSLILLITYAIDSLSLSLLLSFRTKAPVGYALGI